jgi:hypothetical protein
VTEEAFADSVQLASVVAEVFADSAQLASVVEKGYAGCRPSRWWRAHE